MFSLLRMSPITSSQYRDILYIEYFTTQKDKEKEKREGEGERKRQREREREREEEEGEREREKTLIVVKGIIRTKEAREKKKKNVFFLFKFMWYFCFDLLSISCEGPCHVTCHCPLISMHLIEKNKEKENY